MAIGTTPLFSKISGSAGPVDFRTRRNGKIEIGKKRIPTNPQSTEQQNTRNAYGRLHELWQNAAWIDKEQYQNIAAAYDISPWNAFLMRHLPIMRLNPAAYWPFVEGTGNLVHDFTTNENHGTIYGAVWDRLEKYSTPTLYFDGIDDYVNCGTDASLNLTNELLINSITKPTTVTDYHGITGRHSNAANASGTSRFNSRNIEVIINIGGSFTLFSTSNKPIELNKSNQSMYTYNGSIEKIYNNGVEKKSRNNSGIIVTPPPHNWIGETYMLHDQPFEGYFHELFLCGKVPPVETLIELVQKSKNFYGDWS